jgi:hypothetical protein
MFDLEHLGAELAQDRGAVGGGDHRRHVDYAHARERQRRTVRVGHRESLLGRWPAVK